MIDPHGDLADAVVARLPAERRRDLIHLDATDPARVVAFNPLACPDPRLIDQVASGVVSSFKKLHDSWGPRLEDTLRCAVYAIIEQGGNLLSVLRLLGEDAFRARTVAQLRDPVIRAFWIDEFGRWNPAVPHGGRRVHSK